MKRKKVHRKRKPWMDLTQEQVDRLDEENWEHYKKGGCLCSAWCDCECICGAWREDKDEERT